MAEEASPAAPAAAPEGAPSDADRERSAVLERARAKARARRDAALGRPRGAALLVPPPARDPEPGGEVADAPPSAAPSPTRAPVEALVPAPRSEPPAGLGGETGPAAPRLLGAGAARPSSPAPQAPSALLARTTGARRVEGRMAALEKGAPPWSAAAQLSPRMTAIFGAIFGLATVTTVIALLIQSVPPRDEREVVAAAMGSSAVKEGETATAPGSGPTKPAKKARVKVPGPWRLSELEKDPAVRIVSQEMERRAFVKALEEAGVDRAQVYRILKAFDGQRKFDKAGRKDRFFVAIDRATKAVRAFEYVVSPLEVWQAREDDRGLLVASRLDMQVASEEVVGAFYVGKSLASSIDWSIFEKGIDGALDEAYEGHTSTDAFEEGGTVRVIATERTALGDFAGYESITAAEYRGPDPSKPPVRIYAFEGTKSKGYFDERGRQPDGGGWNHAVPGAPITSRFNPKRMHPVLKKVMPHNGTDYGAPTGTPVYAVYRGKVTWIGPRGPAGNLILIEHPNGVETGYYHLSRYADGLKVGQKVAGQQLIGYVGSTGRSTGPHLHLAAKRDGKFFDAETLRMGSFRVVDVDDRPTFLRRKAELDARLDAIPLPEPPPPEPAPVAAAPEDGKAPAAGDGGPGATDPGDGSTAEADPAVDPGAGPDDAKKVASKAASRPDAAPDGDLEDLVGPDLR